MSRVEFGSSSASLQYGILVNLHSLTRAAKAFATFSTDVLSLDLILSRRRRAVAIHSTLVAPPPRVSLQDLPIEILLTIREQLLAVHLSSTPNDFLESHRGFFVADEEYDPDGRPLSLCVCTVTGFGRRCSCVYAEKNAAARARDKALHDQKRDPSKWDQALWDKHEDCDYCLMFVWERVDAVLLLRCREAANKADAQRRRQAPLDAFFGPTDSRYHRQPLSTPRTATHTHTWSPSRSLPASTLAARPRPFCPASPTRTTLPSSSPPSLRTWQLPCTIRPFSPSPRTTTPNFSALSPTLT